jgi:hypothetical protein
MVKVMPNTKTKERLTFRNGIRAGYWCLMPVIVVTWEAEIRRTKVPGQPRQIVSETPPISKITTARRKLKK